MNVKELREAIATLPDDMPIVMQVDPEGNGYGYLAGVDPDAVFVENGRELEVYDLSSSADDNCLDEDDWQELKDKNQRALILWPDR